MVFNWIERGGKGMKRWKQVYKENQKDKYNIIRNCGRTQHFLHPFIKFDWMDGYDKY